MLTDAYKAHVLVCATSGIRCVYVGIHYVVFMGQVNAYVSVYIFVDKLFFMSLDLYAKFLENQVVLFVEVFCYGLLCK